MTRCLRPTSPRGSYPPLRDGLRDAYGSVLSEGIPEEFARCLQRLEPEREGPPGGTPARQGPEPPPRA
jgi:hypothetical protein